MQKEIESVLKEIFEAEFKNRANVLSVSKKHVELVVPNVVVAVKKTERGYNIQFKTINKKIEELFEIARDAIIVLENPFIRGEKK